MDKSLEELLPHKPPMIVLSDVVEFDIDKGYLIARADIKNTDILYLEEMLGVPSYFVLEYMAQSIAVFAGYMDLKNNKKSGIGFLLGTKKLEVFKPVLDVGESYFIKVCQLFMEDNLASFECIVYDKDDNNIASAVISTYRPDNEDNFIRGENE